ATPRGTLQVRPLGQRLPVGASEYTQYFPISFPKGCVLRCRQPADYIRPLGLGGTKKLKDYFIDLKIPRWQRGSIPLVCKDQEVLWAIGCGISETLAQSLGPCLRFTFIPEQKTSSQ
ncbi:MAG: tRNA lysidine(34) synthetase TilS, partial [Christensenellales bacterium]